MTSVFSEIDNMLASVKILVDIVFDRQVLSPEEIMERNPLFPIYLLTADFSERIKKSICVRKQISAGKWRLFLDTCYKKMFSSHVMYLTFVIYACVWESSTSYCIADRFIYTCALVEFFGDETLERTGLSFCALNPEIVMSVYCHLKGELYLQGGFQRLVDRIYHHRFLRCELNENRSVSPDVPFEAKPNPDEIGEDSLSRLLAIKVLENTLIELPALPSYNDLIKRLVAFKKKAASKMAKEKKKIEVAVQSEDLNADVILDGSLSLISDSKTNCNAKHQKEIERCETIIQAVIRYNQSKSFSNDSSNNRIQEEAEGVLEHLKDTIKSLIGVLNKSDNE